MSETALRQTMCDTARRLWERGLIGACEGNLSARLSVEHLLCTPSGVSKGHLAPKDLLVIDLEGHPMGEGKTSSEIKMHTRIMAKRPDCQAIVHAHPTYATAFTLVGETIPNDLIPEAAAVLGNVALVPFAIPGTEEVPVALEPFLPNHKTFLLSHHGAVTLGTNLWDAFNRMETLERIARVIYLARVLGPMEMQSMPADALESLQSLLNGDL